MRHRFRFTGQWSEREDVADPLANIEIGAANASAAMREALRILTMHEREVAQLKYADGTRAAPKARGLIRLELFSIDGSVNKAARYRATGRLT